MSQRQYRLLISRLFPKEKAKTLSLKRAGGQTNRNYVVRVGEKRFFVRIPWEGGGVMDRKAEGKNILALSQTTKLASVLPTYYAYVLAKKNILSKGRRETMDVPDGTMITEYIPGREFTLSDFRDKKYQRALAAMFYTFHKSGVRFANSYNVFRDEIQKYRQKASSLSLERFLDKTTLDQLLLYERDAKKKLNSFNGGVATHNDFIFQNFLIAKDDRLYLLDFEYAGQNKKGGTHYDFGFLFADSMVRKPKMTQQLFEQFLLVADRTYKKKLNREQIYWSAIAATLVQVWWGILRYFAVPPGERRYFQDYVRTRIQGIAQLRKELKEKES